MNKYLFYKRLNYMKFLECLPINKEIAKRIELNKINILLLINTQ